MLTKKNRFYFLCFMSFFYLFTSKSLQAEICWAYVNLLSETPNRCVQQGDTTQNCTWASGRDCHEDGDNSDCCTTIEPKVCEGTSTYCVFDSDCSPGACVQQEQDLLFKHEIWHNCFGSVGDPDGWNPPNRGLRWHSFHRQDEHDFNIYREAGNLCNPSAGVTSGCKIESLDWCPEINLLYGWTCNIDAPPGCGDPGARPYNTTCVGCQSLPQCLFIDEGGPSACTASDTKCSGRRFCKYPVNNAGDLVKGTVRACSNPIAGDVVDSQCPDTVFPDNVCLAEYDSLEDFRDIEEIAYVLDDYFHGSMHGSVGSSGDCKDINSSACSPRDPMFYRLHKVLDDSVRAWQNLKATDVVVVLDRSGSMNGQDQSGTSKKIAALESVDLFAALIDSDRSDGQKNRLGVISYSSDASNDALNLGLKENKKTCSTDASVCSFDADCPMSGVCEYPIGYTQWRSDIEDHFFSGCTSMGAGVEAAISMLCPNKTCSGNTGLSCNSDDDCPVAERCLGDCFDYDEKRCEETDTFCSNNADCSGGPGDLCTDAKVNDRKAVLLLTDGVENTAPCLETDPGSGPSCSASCHGEQVDFDRLAFTQFCALGLGEETNLDINLLSRIAERQGGLYMHSPEEDPDGDWVDVKDFFVKCFGSLTDEFIALDPKLAFKSEGASATDWDDLVYNSCGDEKITFVAGWQDTSIQLKLQIEFYPNSGIGPSYVKEVQSEKGDNWVFARIKLADTGFPHSSSQGTWKARLVKVDDTDVINQASINVLVKGNTEITSHVPSSNFKTGDDLLAGFRVLPGTKPQGGYLSVSGSVTIDRPKLSFGKLFNDNITAVKKVISNFLPIDNLLKAQQICLNTKEIEEKSCQKACVESCNSLNGKLTYKVNEESSELAVGNAACRVLCEGQLAWVDHQAEPTTVNTWSVDNSGEISIDNKTLDLQSFNDSLGPVNLTNLQQIGNFRITSDKKDRAFYSLAQDKRLEALHFNIGSQLVKDYCKSSGGEKSPCYQRTVFDDLKFEEGWIEKVIARTTQSSSSNSKNFKGTDNGYFSLQINPEGRVSGIKNSSSFSIIENGKKSFRLSDELTRYDGAYDLHYKVRFNDGSCEIQRELKHSFSVATKVEPDSSSVTPLDDSGSYMITPKGRPGSGLALGPGKTTAVSCTGGESCLCKSVAISDQQDGRYKVTGVTPGCGIKAFGVTFPSQPSGSSCGNGIIESGEECDNGLLEDSCCSSTCQINNVGKVWDNKLKMWENHIHCHRSQNDLATGHIIKRHGRCISGSCLLVPLRCFPGDVNGDGTHTVVDIISMISFILDLNRFDLNSCELKSLDMNVDGQKNILDVVNVVSIILNGYGKDDHDQVVHPDHGHDH
ncbi:MAG: hypothetical protein CMP11_05430 [Zetaproteobacteria bacterium]|nr:hypothetical protein [Pseudobdellovibrionaceae bacterium]